jgi:4-alpha-glucanotransferase
MLALVNSTLDFNSVRYRTDGMLHVVAAEDVFDMADQVNVPGTITEHPHWRRRLPVLVENFASDARLSAVAEVLRSEGRAVSPDRP